MKKLPKIIVFCLYVLNKNKNYENVIGDFEEYYNEKLKRSGYISAYFWCLRQTILSIPKFFKTTTYWSFEMFKNYLIITLRNIKRNKSYSFINVFGLAIGIASCLLIMLFIKDETSYDKYHENSDRTYRIFMERTYPDKVRNWGWTAPILASTILKDFPEVEKAVRIFPNGGQVQVNYLSKNIAEKNILWTDKSFFNVFSIKMLDGDPNTALENPNSVVITKSIAEKYFGDENPMGKNMIIGPQSNNRSNSFIVTGITENTPANTHFSYDFLLSFNTRGMSNADDWTALWILFTYVVLNENADKKC